MDLEDVVDALTGGAGWASTQSRAEFVRLARLLDAHHLSIQEVEHVLLTAFDAAAVEVGGRSRVMMPDVRVKKSTETYADVSVFCEKCREEHVLCLAVGPVSGSLRQAMEADNWNVEAGECPKCRGTECHCVVCNLAKPMAEDTDPDQQEVNVCEHGDHPAPAGERFCSQACKACEVAECGEDRECAGLCLQQSYEDGKDQPR